MPRAQRKEPEPEKLRYIPSGGVLLDLVLGGGWAEGRVANIVGDRSSGKTLLAIEASANFDALYHAPERIAYRESEAAFDMPYAETMGMPHGVDWSEDIRTVEDMDKDLAAWTEKVKEPNLYVLDSLDALSDDAETEREIGTATYGMAKPKLLSEMFRRRVADLRKNNCTMLIISQIRDKIGVTFGETKTRSGGRALDFYSTQIVWLAEIGKIKRVVKGVERVVGVHVKARNKKNKAGLAFREADFSILFGYGVDDEQSMLDWLKKHKADDYLDEPMSVYEKAYKEARKSQDRAAAKQVHSLLRKATRACWADIEAAVTPPMSKYER